MRTEKRIQKLADSVLLVRENFLDNIVVCDVGTDHGYLAEKLSKNNKIKKVLATDISEKSLSKLEKLISSQNLKNIETFVGNGLEPIERADATVIAGIGGYEIITILKNQNIVTNFEKNLPNTSKSKSSENTVKCRYFVLQPAQNVRELREFLMREKIKILSDKIFEDNSRFYPIIIVDVLEKEKNKMSIFNLWLGRDNEIFDEDFRKFLVETKIELAFFENLPKKRIIFDKKLKEKYKLFRLVEKLTKV